MAAIVTKFGGFGRGRVANKEVRKNRATRVSAKAATRAKQVKDKDPDADELDPEALADDVEVVEEKAEKAKKAARPDAGTYLSMYFRDMAALDVLRPEEEFTSAKEIEALEIMLWEVVLSHAPGIEHVLAAVELVMETLPAEAKTLRKVADEAPEAKAWTRTVSRAARRLRADDVDHLFIDAALMTIDRISIGVGVRGNSVGSLGRERALARSGCVASTPRIARPPRHATTSCARTFASSSRSRAASTTVAWHSPT
jgi:hypothetical protein